MQTTNTAETRRRSDARARFEKLESCYLERDRHEEGSPLWVEWQANIDALNVASARAMGLRVG